MNVRTNRDVIKEHDKQPWRKAEITAMRSGGDSFKNHSKSNNWNCFAQPR